MLLEYPKFKRGEIWTFKLPKEDKEIIEKYLIFRQGRGNNTKDKLNDIKRYTLQFRHILAKPFKSFNLDNLRQYLAIINKSHLSEHVKNSLKVDIKNFLMFLFKDWSYRFNNLDDIKLNGNVMNERKINSQNIFSDGDISNLLKAETKPFWRAYLMLCYEAGLRTIEGRTIKWEDIRFNIDEDISEIKVFSTKTKTARTCFIKDATFYLKKLQEMQEAEKTKGIYVFNSGRKDKLNNPISKSAVNVWFRRLTKRVLGKELWCYLLRHSRATALYKLAKENKISKDTAISFMGHSNDMSKKYTHLDIEDIKKMMRNQVYNLSELAPEKKASLEKEISELKKQLEGYKICLNEGLQNLKTEFLSVFADTKKIKEKLILAKIK